MLAMHMRVYVCVYTSVCEGFWGCSLFRAWAVGDVSVQPEGREGMGRSPRSSLFAVRVLTRGILRGKGMKLE